MLECVINVSEGQDEGVIAGLLDAAGARLLDAHVDADHHRSVLTLGGEGADVEKAARAVAARAVETIDLGAHAGVHPRFGVVDVVPFVSLTAGPAPGPARARPAPGRPGAGQPPTPPAGGPGPAGAHRLRDGPIGDAIAARNRFAAWAGDELALPCFCYGPERSLPQVRRAAWKALPPTRGPAAPHPTAGSCAVGARPVLVAYNLWLAAPADPATARAIARDIRGPGVRALGLAPGGGAQVSCNLIAPWRVGPAAVYDAVARRAPVARGELVGLLPASILDAIPAGRWESLGLSPAATIEARLQQAGLDGGRPEGG